jgi:UDP-glucose 4-epimerase
MREDSTPRPMSPYAVSKLAAENYCSVFSRLDKVETVCLRYFNVYGPRQRSSEYSGVIAAFQDRVRRNKPPIIYGDGKQTRDFVNVHDIVEANILAMKAKNVAGETFNIGTGRRISVHKLAEMIVRASRKTQLSPIHAPARLGDVKHGYADIRKARRCLSYSPKLLLDRYIVQLASCGMTDDELNQRSQRRIF